MSEKIDRMVELCFLILFVILVSILVSIELNSKTNARIENMRTEIVETCGVLKKDLVEIRLLLEMFVEAVPTGKEVIYLDEDTEDWLNDDRVTGVE